MSSLNAADSWAAHRPVPGFGSTGPTAARRAAQAVVTWPPGGMPAGVFPRVGGMAGAAPTAGAAPRAPAPPRHRRPEGGITPPTEFVDFYRSTFPKLLAQQHAILGDRAEAHATVRAAFVQAWRGWETVRIHPDRTGWVRHAAGSMGAKERRRAMAGNPPPPDGGMRADPELLGALARLPLVQRRALVLHYMAALPAEAIAKEEGSSVHTIRTRLALGHMALARYRDNAEPPSPGADFPGGAAARAAARELSYLRYRLASVQDIPPLNQIIDAPRPSPRPRRVAAGAVVAIGALAAVTAVVEQGHAVAGEAVVPTGQESTGQESTGPARTVPAEGPATRPPGTLAQPPGDWPHHSPGHAGPPGVPHEAGPRGLPPGPPLGPGPITGVTVPVYSSMPPPR